MILHRVVIHCKQGTVNEVVAMLKKGVQDLPIHPMILTDLSGPFNTVVVESKFESLAAYETWRSEFFGQQQSADSDLGIDAMFESGSNEFYTVELE